MYVGNPKMGYQVALPAWASMARACHSVGQEGKSAKIRVIIPSEARNLLFLPADETSLSTKLRLQEFVRSTKMVDDSLVCDEVNIGTNALALRG